MLLPVAGELTAWITDNVTLNAPSIPYVSNVTGKPATAEVVTDPGYWARHMCETVEFGAGLAHALGMADLALVEIGPGQSLGALTRGHPACDRAQWPLIVTTVPAANDRLDVHAATATAVAKLWLAGAAIDWDALHDGWTPGRVPLPTYPFEHQDYWLEIDKDALSGSDVDENDPMSIMNSLPRLPDSEWINVPTWKQTTPRPPRAEEGDRWLVYTDSGLADTIAASLRDHLTATGAQVVLVRPGERFAEVPGGVTVRPGSPEDAVSALRHLAERDSLPERVVHLWTADDGRRTDGGDPTEDCLQRGLHTLIALARAAGDIGLPAWTLDIVTVGGQRVLPGDLIVPERGTLLGPTRLIPVEYPRVKTRLIDIDPESAGRALLTELRAAPADQVVSLRGGRRWTPE
jgi:acyl transferase domain-containing protein